MTAAWAVGLMTGTVLDGMIDIALLRTDGETVDTFGPWALAPYAPEVRTLLAEAVRDALRWGFDGPEPLSFAVAEAALSRAQAEAVADFLARHGVAPAEVAVVGFHGQTVLHAPPADGGRGRTRQLGDGQLMADRLGIAVVYDFRSADMAAGGQGAPLSAVYHRALLRRIGAGPETVILNLGGVANLTWCDGDTMIAFDTGPANAPLNDWVARHGRGEMDRDAAIALAGTVDETRLATLLAHPYFTAPYPKSLDRHGFTAAMAEGLDLADGAATLTAFTAGAVARALALLPRRVDRLVVCGGGRKNPLIMAELARRTDAVVLQAEDVGFRGDAVEAELFALLAVRAVRGLPISFPLTTGVAAPMRGGVLARPRGTPAPGAAAGSDPEVSG